MPCFWSNIFLDLMPTGLPSGAAGHYHSDPSTYNACLDFEHHNGTLRDFMNVCILGYLIIYSQLDTRLFTPVTKAMSLFLRLSTFVDYYIRPSEKFSSESNYASDTAWAVPIMNSLVEFPVDRTFVTPD